MDRTHRLVIAFAAIGSCAALDGSLLTACSSVDPYGECSRDADCKSNQICTVERRCRTIDGDRKSSMDDARVPATNADSTAHDAAVAASSSEPSSPATSGAGGAPAVTGAAQAGATAGASGATGTAGDAAMSNAARLGAACTRSSECPSNVCEDGVCCEKPCGECQRCNASGQCEAVRSAVDPGTCLGSNTICSAAGKCVTTKGGICSNDSACESGHCVEQVCCDVANCGACTTCAGGNEAGTCTPINGEDDPRGCTGGMRSCTRGECVQIDDPGVFAPPAKIQSLPLPAGEIAQTITMRSSGHLVEVRMVLSCADPNESLNFFFKIASVDDDGTPHVPVTDGQPERATPGQPGDLRVSISFSHPVAVTAGMRLGLVIAPRPHKECWIDASVSDIYAGGQAWVDQSQSKGQVQFEPQAYDYVFTALVKP